MGKIKALILGNMLLFIAYIRMIIYICFNNKKTINIILEVAKIPKTKREIDKEKFNKFMNRITK